MIDLYFNPNYAKVYTHIDGISETYHLECPYGKITNTFILRPLVWKINDLQYYDIVTPYGYGGPLAEDVSDIRALMQTYQEDFSKYCEKHHIICEFIRFHLFDNQDVRMNYYGETLHILDNIVVNTRKDFETEIWPQYEHKVRKNVKKALANQLTILIEKNCNHLDEFLSIYNSTMNRNNASDYYYFGQQYFEDIANLLPNNYIYFHVLKDNKIISTELVLFSERYAYSFLGGTLADYYDCRPNDFLKNEIIKWCYEQGIQQFILGGGYHKDDGIYRYKKGFTPDEDVPFYIGRHIFNQDIYQQAISKRQQADASFDINTPYFPAYRG